MPVGCLEDLKVHNPGALTCSSKKQKNDLFMSYFIEINMGVSLYGLLC